MRRALLVLAWVAVFVVAYVVARQVGRLVGPGLVSALAATAWGAVAWLCHTERSRDMAADLLWAIHKEGLTRQQAADEMGERYTHLIDAFAGTRMLGLWRVAELSDKVLVAFATRILRRYAPQYLVIDSEAVRDLIATVRALKTERALLEQGRVVGA